ncbi:hypothetical protein EJ04DRAFT_270479 [Polyplosphaeria fusca]|uniref:Uncharacterized protein n=1 Tax=Polyplosphaeria fusca TaxID=682080 RepID=A0A9P4V2N4_9PLEO|nr:hypothetical protein EJ04DRAFT_270479 [Polyplosphaeria fusca]
MDSLFGLDSVSMPSRYFSLGSFFRQVSTLLETGMEDRPWTPGWGCSLIPCTLVWAVRLGRHKRLQVYREIRRRSQATGLFNGRLSKVSHIVYTLWCHVHILHVQLCKTMVDSFLTHLPPRLPLRFSAARTAKILMHHSIIISVDRTIRLSTPRS